MQRQRSGTRSVTSPQRQKSGSGQDRSRQTRVAGSAGKRRGGNRQSCRLGSRRIERRNSGCSAGRRCDPRRRSRGRQQDGSGRHHCVSAGRPRRRVCEPICRRTAADRSAHRRRYRIWARLSDTPELKIYASLRSRASLNSKVAGGPGSARLFLRVALVTQCHDGTMSLADSSARSHGCGVPAFSLALS